LYSTNKDKTPTIEQKSPDLILEKPESPLTCCGSGCQNCVYLKYAEELMKYYEHKYSDSSLGMKEAVKEVNRLTDENLKSYILMEIVMRFR
jgi:hypothetical protein